MHAQFEIHATKYEKGHMLSHPDTGNTLPKFNEVSAIAQDI
jgi:hypothetical protein